MPRTSKENAIENSSPNKGQPQSETVMADAAFNIIEPALRMLAATGLPDGTLLRDACDAAIRGTDEKPGTYMTKLYSARRFHALKIERESPVKPAKFFWRPLGRALSDPETAPGARVEAFRNVPLHAAVIARSNTGEKVDDAKIAAVMRDEFGLSDSRVIDSARQVLKRAAVQAGLLDKEYRWVIPPEFSSSDSRVRQETQDVTSYSTATNPATSPISTVVDEPPTTLQVVQRQSGPRGQDIDPIFTVVAQEMPKLDAPFVEDEWDEWFGIFTEAFKRAKRRARQRSMLQSAHDNGQEEA